MLSRQRIITSYRDGIARPYVLKVIPKHIDLSESLIQIFQDAVGRRRYEIEEEISRFNIEKINPKVIQGLAELLFKRSRFDEPGSVDALDLRRSLFSSSATYWKSVTDENRPIHHHRRKILSNAQIPELQADDIDASHLFGDIAANQKLTEIETIDAESLIHRFNIAQVQGLLIHARKLELSIHRRDTSALKQVMQMMKFFQLMFDLQDSTDNWITMLIDGPGAVLENSRSYGFELAQFFPAILLLNIPWKLNAQLKVPNRRRLFTLEISEDNPYHSYYQLRNVWTHQKLKRLLDRFSEKYGSTHRVTPEPEIIPISDNRYLLPDFTIALIESDPGNESRQRQLRFEWVHYPSESKLKRIRQLKPQLPADYVFAIKGSKEKLKPLIKAMQEHLLVYAKDLTATAVMRKVEEKLS